MRLYGRGASRAALLMTAVLSAAGAVVTTWPLARDMSRATLRSGEVLLTAWQLNWFQQALLTNPLAWADANIFFPYRGAAAFNDLLISHALITLPVAWADSPVLALNLAFLVGIVLCGVCAHALIVELVDDPWAGAVGGTLFALAPFRFLHVGHLSIAAAWAIPLFFWALLRHLREPSLPRAWLTALAGCLVVMSSLYHAAYVAPLLPLVILAGAQRGPRSRRVWIPLAATSVPALAVCAGLLAPFASAMRDHGVASAADDLERHSADLSSLTQSPSLIDASPTPINPEAYLYPGAAISVLALAGLVMAVAALGRQGGWRRAGAIGGVGFAGVVALGAIWPLPPALHGVWRASALAMIWIGPVVLAVLAMASVRARDAFDPRAAIAFGVAGAAAAFALALGPVARHVDVVLGPAPYSLLVKLSAAFAGVRVPARFGGIALLFLAVAAGAVIALVLRSPRMVAAARAAVVMAALVSCAVELPVPPLPKGHSLVPTPRLRDRAYRWLAERPGKFGVLELPDWQPDAQVGWQYREWRSLRYMLASKQHGQHLVNGSARLEPFLWARFRNLDPWSDEFFTFITSYFPVEYILVHQGGLPEDLRRAILSRLDSGQDGWRQVFDSPAIRIYQPDRTFGRGRQIDRLFLRQGLGGFVTIRFSARLVSNAVATATLELRQNGALVTTFALDAQWRLYEASAPVTQATPEPTEWPRSATLFRWQLSDVEGAEIEVRDLVVEARDGPER